MRYSISALAAALLLGGASVALAQTGTSPMPQGNAAGSGITGEAGDSTAGTGEIPEAAAPLGTGAETAEGDPLADDADTARADPASDAPAGEETAMGVESVRVMLEAKGYRNIDSIEKVGEAFTASAERDGEEHELRIDAETGEISEN